MTKSRRSAKYRTRIELALEGIALNISSASSLDKTAKTAVDLLHTLTRNRPENKDYR